jgi:hypothetical protein
VIPSLSLSNGLRPGWASRPTPDNTTPRHVEHGILVQQLF